MGLLCVSVTVSPSVTVTSISSAFFVSYTLGWPFDLVVMWISSFAFSHIVTMILYLMFLRLGIYRIIIRFCRIRQRVRGVLHRVSHTIYITVSFVFVMLCKRVDVIISKYSFTTPLPRLKNLMERHYVCGVQNLKRDLFLG